MQHRLKVKKRITRRRETTTLYDYWIRSKLQIVHNYLVAIVNNHQ